MAVPEAGHHLVELDRPFLPVDLLQRQPHGDAHPEPLRQLDPAALYVDQVAIVKGLQTQVRELAVSLRRQRVSLEHVARQRDTLGRQLESAGLTLGNLRLDLVKLRASGLDSALGEVTSATQEARVLAREIGMALEAVAEVKEI